jgi:hypothetical protein
MSTEIVEKQDLSALITFSVTDSTIARIQKEYLCLTVKDPSDKVGYAECDTARKEVKSLRVSVEKRRKELKEDSLRFGQKVDAEAKRLSAQLEAVEAHLHNQQRIVDDEKERVRLEEERKAATKLQERLDALQRCQAVYSIELVRAMTDEEFCGALFVATEAHRIMLASQEAERKRILELEAKQKEQEALIRQQEAEAKRLRDELLEKQRVELEVARQEADKAARQVEEAQAIRVRAEQALEVEKTLAAEQAVRFEQERAAAEARASRKVKDRELFDRIKKDFPTLESAWVEIARLVKAKEA